MSDRLSLVVRFGYCKIENISHVARYVVAEYGRIKRITMPSGDDYLLYLTTEVQADHLNIINRIRKLEAGLRYSK